MFTIDKIVESALTSELALIGDESRSPNDRCLARARKVHHIWTSMYRSVKAVRRNVGPAWHGFAVPHMRSLRSPHPFVQADCPA